MGIDSPEHEFPPAQCAAEAILGVAAKEFAKTLLKPGDVVHIRWDGSTREKYGRLIGDVTTVDNHDFGTLMVDGGHARRYNGGHKAPWV